ncbi:MAG TPA: 50S ribosomal protein L4 [Oligoflexia bacterium]|nr:50S ribosomal protein L4 [Oligoflexia bacterium]
MSSAELKLYDATGKQVGTRPVPAEVFAGAVVPGVLHQVVRWQRAKKRAGTHSVQTRAEMTGGGRKPWRQKGLGRARAGSNTSPLWVGGGVAHGPKPRSYEFGLNKKERKKALCGAISARTQEGRCFAVTSFDLEEIKTKQAAKALRQLGIPRGEKVAVVTGDDETTAVYSLRNIAGVTVMSAAGLSVYDILNANYLVITEKGLAGIEGRFALAAK